jgi:hypothetical protein
MKTLSTLIPVTLHNPANHLAACIGTDARLKDGTLADLITFGNPTHQHEGDLFIWVNARVSDEKAGQLAYLIAHPELLQRPAFDTGGEIDMQAAASALAECRLVTEPLEGYEGGMLVGIDVDVVPPGFMPYSDE